MPTDDDEMHLQDYLTLLRRRKWWVLGAAAVVFGLVAAATLTRDEVYRTRADVLVRTEATNDLFPRPAHELVDAEFIRTIDAELTFVSGQDFRSAAREAVGFASSVEISNLAVVGASGESSVISFTARSSDPERAAAAANGYADTYLSLRHELFVANVQVTIEEELADSRADLDVVQNRLDALLDPVEEIEALADAETDAVAQATLIEQVARLRAEAEAQRPAIERQAEELQATVDELDDALGLLAEPGAIGRVLNSAPVQRDPISPNVERNLLLGALAAAVLGLGVGLARDLVDQRVGDQLSFASFGQRVLTRVPTIRPPLLRRRERRFDELPTRVQDRYRQVRNSLAHLQAEQGLRTVAITAGSSDASSVETAVNLAEAIARSGQRVALVGADLRGSRRGGGLAAHLGVDVSPGLEEMCLGGATFREWIQLIDPDTLYVLTGGAQSGIDPDLLTADAVGAAFRQFVGRTEMVVVDCAPVLSDPNAELIASQADGVIVVVSARHTRGDSLTRSLARLEDAGANVIGLVATDSRSSG